MDIQQLIELDKEVFLALNGCHSLFWDGFMWTATKTITWIPVALALLYVIFKNNKPQQAVYIVLSVTLCVLLSDQITSGLCKPFFARFRPTQDPEMMYLVHTVNGYRGGLYGFMSSHAANTFTVAMFLSLLIRNWKLSVMTFSWAIIATYSRIYLGVHYPGDILCGATVGILVATLVFIAFCYFNRKNMNSRCYAQSQQTATGYNVQHIDLFSLVLLLTYMAVILIGMIRAKLLFF